MFEFECNLNVKIVKKSVFTVYKVRSEKDRQLDTNLYSNNKCTLKQWMIWILKAVVNTLSSDVEDDMHLYIDAILHWSWQWKNM